jgi:hypothetical protein
LEGRLPSPPIQFGDFGMATLPESSTTMACHCAGVLAIILKACTGPFSSTAKAAFTSRWRATGLLALANCSDTTTTLKCVSEFFGTLCMCDSFRTTRCEGSNAWVSFSVMEASTGSIFCWEDDVAVDMLMRCRPTTPTTGAVAGAEAVREKRAAVAVAVAVPELLVVTKCDECEAKARAGVKAATEDCDKKGEDVKASKDVAKREPSNALL